MAINSLIVSSGVALLPAKRSYLYLCTYKSGRVHTENVITTVVPVPLEFDSVVFETTKTSWCELRERLTEERDRTLSTRPARYANDSSNLSNSMRHTS